MSDGDRGRFVWFECMTRDPAGAVAFYADVLGWGTTTWGDGDDAYTMWTADDVPIGGIMDLAGRAPDEVSPHWLGYVHVDDVEAAASGAEERGGEVMVEPTPIPDMGSFSVLRDPQGATFAVWSGGDAPEGDPEGVGRVTWNELATTDPEGAWDFYSSLLGWEKTEGHDMGEMGVYQLFGAGGDHSMGGYFRKPPEMPGPPAWLHYVRVEDVNEVVEKVKAAGGRVLNGPMEVPGGDWIAQCMDPHGAPFAVTHRAAPAG